MKLQVKKPKILKDKIALADFIREHWTTTNFHKHPSGPYYWKGTFTSPSGQLKISVHFQNYELKPGVDYVDLHWQNEGLEGKALRAGDIKPLLKSFAKGDFR